MTRSGKKISLLAAAVMTVCAGFQALSMGETAATTAPATAASQSAGSPRTERDIVKDLKTASTQLGEVLGTLSANPLPKLMDESVRNDIAPKAIPPLQKMAGLLQELRVSLTKSDTGGPPVSDTRLIEQRDQILAMLMFLGDTGAEKTLATDAKSTNAPEALNAKLASSLATWWRNNKNAAAQGKILDQMQELAKANKSEDAVAGTLIMMSKLGAASPEIGKRASGIVASDLTGELAQKVQGGPTVDEPFGFEGPTTDGKKFSTKDLKGKVIVVDFWATWCGPCRAELPDVVKIYEKYHEKGLEIVGVSLDNDVESLTNFLGEHKEMPWPQIFDAKQPLAKRYGVEAIPTMFIIDRNGVLRSTEARGQLEELIPKLLDEKVKDTAVPAPAPAAKDGAKTNAK